MGGLLKFVTVDPSTEQLNGRLQSSVSSLSHGDDMGYSVRGAINIPVSDTFAVRTSAFTRSDPGYIDNVQTGEDDVNKTDVNGGRISALWRPNASFSLKLSGLLQNSRRDGASTIEVQPGLTDLETRALRGTGWFKKKVQAYSGIATFKPGDAELTSLSGWSRNSFKASIDFSDAFAPFGLDAVPNIGDIKTEKLSQELRLSMPLSAKVDWLFGAFYTDEDSFNEVDSSLADIDTGETIVPLLHREIPTTFEEYAAFTDFTFHVRDRFDIQVGGRGSENRQTYRARTVNGAGDSTTPRYRTKDSAFTYLLTPKFKVSPDLMLYARLASGYRAGGINSGAELNDYPIDFGADKTQNYEIGVKGNAFDRLLTFDASVYYISWKDLQIILTDPVSQEGYIVNAGRAKSQGVELSLESRPLTGLRIATWMAWGDPVLTEDFPPLSAAFGVSGNRLPDSSRLSGNFSIDQEFPLGSVATAFVGGSISYIGDRKGVFTATPLRQTYPAYAQTDLRAGMNYNDWTLNLFVNNLTDKRGLLSGGLGNQVNELAFTYIQPRAVGLSVAKTF
jgi:outer membrane receptor protein involved in Fe transport